MGGVHERRIAWRSPSDSFMQYAEDMLRREPKSDAAGPARSGGICQSALRMTARFQRRGYNGMGTTIVGGVIKNNGNGRQHRRQPRLLYGGRRRHQQVTRDHSLVEELVDRGAITAEGAHATRERTSSPAPSAQRNHSSDIFRAGHPSRTTRCCSAPTGSAIFALTHGEMESFLLASSDDDGEPAASSCAWRSTAARRTT